MKTYRYLYGTDLAGAYEEIFRSAGLTAYLRDQKHILGVSNKLEEIRVLYSFDKLNGYGQHPKKDIPLVVQYMPMADAKVAVWGVGGAANAGNEGVWADLSNNTGRSTTYTQLELFDLEEAAGTGNYSHLDILFGMEKLQDQDVVDARNGRRDMRANVRIEHVAPVMRQMDKEHVLAAAEALYEGKNVVFHLERGISFPYRSRELLMQLYSMLPPLFAKEIGYSCYCRADSVKDLTRHNFRVFVVPGEEALDSRNFPERQYLILDMSSRRNAGTSELWNVLENWWEMPWAERVEVMRWQFRDTDQLASTNNASKFIATSSTYQEKLRSYNNWKAQKTSVPTGVTLEDLVNEYSRYKFWDDVPGAKETFARWSKLVLGGEEVLLNLTENAFAEFAMGTDADKQRTARRQYNLGSQLCRPRGSGLQKNIQSRIDSKVAAECALVVKQKNAEIQTLKDDHEATLQRINNAISKLKSDHSDELQRKDDEISKLKEAHTKELEKKDEDILELNKAHEEKLGKLNKAHDEAILNKDNEITKLKNDHGQELQKKDNEITNLKNDHGQKLQEKDAEITNLKNDHSQKLQEKDAEITNLKNDHDQELQEKTTEIEGLKKDLESQTSHYDTQIAALSTKICNMEESHDKEIGAKKKEIEVLQTKFDTLQIMLNGNNAAKQLDWLMGIPVLGLGVKALVNRKFADMSAEDKPVVDEETLINAENLVDDKTAVDSAARSIPTTEDAPSETPAVEEAPNETPAVEEAPNETPAVEEAPNETPAAEEAPKETIDTDSVDAEKSGEGDSGAKSEERGKQKKHNDQKGPSKNNRQNILFAAVIGLFAIVISAVILFKPDILPWPPVETTTPASSTAPVSEPTTSDPSESTAASTETKPVTETTVSPESKFEVTPKLVGEILKAFADENADKNAKKPDLYAQTTFAGHFPEGCGLKPIVLFSREKAENGELPSNYVLVLKEAPEKVDDLYAYIDYGALHIAVNRADRHNDITMQLAFQIFEKLYASVEYPEGIQFHARLNRYEDPVDLVYTFQALEIEDWYLQIESWKSGDSTKDYKNKNKIEYQPYVVVEGGVEGKRWSIAYIPGDIYNDSAEREDLKKKYKLYKTMDTGWALYQIEGQDAPAETVAVQTADPTQP